MKREKKNKGFVWLRSCVANILNIICASEAYELKFIRDPACCCISHSVVNETADLRFFCNCCYYYIVYVFFLCLYSILLCIFRVGPTPFVLFVITMRKIKKRKRRREESEKKRRVTKERDHTR